MCKYPNCTAVSGEKQYCQHHIRFIIETGLCYNCVAPKENKEHRLCRKCYTTESVSKRQEAITAGKCANFWKCHRDATQGQHLCQVCFADLAKQREARNLKLRQTAIETGKCTNYWRCDKPASRVGGMCLDCYRGYLQQKPKNGAPVPSAQDTSSSGTKVVPTKTDFPAMGRKVIVKRAVWPKQEVTAPAVVEAPGAPVLTSLPAPFPVDDAPLGSWADDAE